ncbi:hypothetical protein HON52_01190 [Candidatus Uhrbacteria bacterium]|jgi:hypothetical protein|nr:hypothetical protein [Candidatus Uhrbacteria bacterium]
MSAMLLAFALSFFTPNAHAHDCAGASLQGVATQSVLIDWNSVPPIVNLVLMDRIGTSASRFVNVPGEEVNPRTWVFNVPPTIIAGFDGIVTNAKDKTVHALIDGSHAHSYVNTLPVPNTYNEHPTSSQYYVELATAPKTNTQSGGAFNYEQL